MALRASKTQNLRRFNKDLLKVSAVAAINVAREAAAVLNGFLASDYDAGNTVYGDSRASGVRGEPLDLVVTRATRNNLRFSSDGTSKIRVVGLPNYARYLIGKYRILPIGNAALPFKWNSAIRDLLDREMRKIISGET
jgi:hypothetical protein